MPFHDRLDELALLDRRLSSSSAELLIVYGRRRVGKTELLAHVAEKARCLFFEATDTVASEQLRDLSHELALVTGDRALEAEPLRTWPAMLAAIERFVADRRTLVVLDEFQYLARQSHELQTTLNRWWRTRGRELPIVLVLAGSELSFFEDEVLAGQLYGRPTGQLRLEPFQAREAALFHPGYSPADRVRAYSICGGIPYYLERFDDSRSLRDAILAEVLYRDGLLHDEAELMLRQSIPQPANHMATLRAIAHGQTRNNQIAQRTELRPAHVHQILATLERLGLVEQLRPVTASPRAKRTAYALADPFLTFHFRYVDPARSRLRTDGDAERYLTQHVLPTLDRHASQPTWERIAHQHVWRTVDGVSAVGRWWGQVPTGEARRTEQREIDVVALDEHRTPIAAGMCKWTGDPVDVDELQLLRRLLAQVEGSTGRERLLLFSRSGFTDRLARQAANDPEVHLISPDEIYA